MPERRVPDTDRTVPGADTAAADVVLAIPATHSHVRLARLAASGIGAQLEADVEKIEELRLLVDEACALLLECAVPGDEAADRLHMTFRPSTSSLTVTVERRGATLVDRPSPISAAVLDAVSDRWSLEGTSVQVVVSIVDGVDVPNGPAG